MLPGLECASLTERVKWAKMALGGDMTSFLERLPGAVAMSALCLLIHASWCGTQAGHVGTRVRWGSFSPIGYSNSSYLMDPKKIKEKTNRLHQTPSVFG